MRGGIQEHVDCIEICDNVFVGSNTTILSNVRIGSNVIIAAGSLVNKDIPDNSVVAGVPAKVIGTFSDFVSKRQREEKYPVQPVIGNYVPKELEDWLWQRFYQRRDQ